MRTRNRTLAVTLLIITLPAVFALTDAVAFAVHNRNNGSVISSGERREYLLYVPRRYDPSRRTPLVISLHGAGGWPVQQMEMSRWNRVAEREGFLVVYPAGSGRGTSRIWRARPGGVAKDVRFISDLIDEIAGAYNVDRQRVYANGLSNGGGMSFALSCMLSDRIAAAGLVASAQTLPFQWCAGRRAVPVIAFHGTADPMTPYHGGTTWVAPNPFPDIPRFVGNWARRNGCARVPVESLAAPDVTRREYVGCQKGATVVLYTIHGGGHSWPGGAEMPDWFVGATTRSIDASSEMWAFFSRHRLPG